MQGNCFGKAVVEKKIATEIASIFKNSLGDASRNIPSQRQHSATLKGT
jgi:hypothetical protein